MGGENWIAIHGDYWSATDRKSLAITANTPFSQWGEVFVEPAMTLAAVDRLVYHSTILEMNVESYRRRAAQQGLASPARRTR